MEVNISKNGKGYPPKENTSIEFVDALLLTGYGKFNYTLIGISGIIITSTLLETLSICYVIPVACDLSLTPFQNGILSSVCLIGIIVSSHLWGFLADTKGRKAVIVPTLILSFLCSAISSLGINFSFLVIMRFLTGFFISGSGGTIYAYLGEFHNSKNSERAIMAASTIFGIGSTFLPVLAWLIISHQFSFKIPIIETVYKPWNLLILTCGIPSLFCGLVLLIFPESPKFVLGQGKQKGTIEILKTMYNWNTGKDKNNFKKIFSIQEESSSCTIKDKSVWAQLVSIFEPEYLMTTLTTCTIQFFIFASAHGMYFWYPETINKVAEFREKYPSERITICEILDMKHINSSDVSSKECSEYLDSSAYWTTIILESLYFVGFVITGLLINKVGKLSIIVVTLISCGSFGLAASFVDLTNISMYFYLILLFCAVIVPVLNAATVDLYPTNIRGMAVCVLLMIGRLGSVIGSNFFKFLMDGYCFSSFMVSGITLIGSGLLAFFIPNIRNKVSSIN